jgi:hypothetical protein
LVSMGIALGYFFFLPHGHGLAKAATAKLSHRFATRLRRLGCFWARLFGSVPVEEAYSVFSMLPPA